MRKLRLMVMLFLGFLINLLPYTAFADSHQTPGWIFQYGNNGGVAFSITATETSILDTSYNGIYYTYTKSDSSIQSSDGGVAYCGDYFSVRNYTTFDSTDVSLPYPSSYIVNSGTAIVGQNSGSTWTTTRYPPYSASVENVGNVQPNPSSCYGGGSVTDSWTDSN